MYRLQSFDSLTGMLTISLEGMADIHVEVPVEDGKFLTGEALHSYLKGFIPVWEYDRRAKIVQAENAEAVHAMCAAPAPVTNAAPSYIELRSAAYPSIFEYVDAVVKNDEAAQSEYIQKCLAVKALYPKPEQVTSAVLRERLGT